MDQGKLNPGERIDQLRNEAKNPNRSMLRHTHFGTKGGERTFVALRTKDCNADKVGLMYQTHQAGCEA